MAKKRNEEKFFLKIFVQKLWPKRGLEDLRKKQGIWGVVGKHKIWGVCIFHQAKMNNNMSSNYLEFTFGMLKSVGIFLVRQILKLDLALGMP